MLAALVVGCLLAAASGLILCPPHQARAFVEMSPSFMRKFGRPDAALLTPNNTVAVDLGNTNSCIAGFDDGVGGTAVFRICIPTALAALADDDEPTAAAVAHGLHRSLRDRGNVLVLHVGGGTSAAAVLTYRDGGFEGLGSAHDLRLGGDDFSQRITDHLVALMKDRHGVDATSSKDNNNGGLLRKLRMESERAKKELSRQPRAHVKVDFPNNAGAVMFFSKTLTRSEFEHLNQVLDLQDRLAQDLNHHRGRFSISYLSS